MAGKSKNKQVKRKSTGVKKVNRLKGQAIGQVEAINPQAKKPVTKAPVVPANELVLELKRIGVVFGVVLAILAVVSFIL